MLPMGGGEPLDGIHQCCLTVRAAVSVPQVFKSRKAVKIVCHGQHLRCPVAAREPAGVDHREELDGVARLLDYCRAVRSVQLLSETAKQIAQAPIAPKVQRMGGE